MSTSMAQVQPFKVISGNFHQAHYAIFKSALIGYFREMLEAFFK